MTPSIPIMISRAFIIFFAIAVPLAFLVGIVLLQVHLSKRESKLPGLILPMITFGMTLLVVIGIAAFNIIGTTTTTTTLTLERVESMTEVYYERHATDREAFVPNAEIVHHIRDYGTISTAPVAAILFILIFFNIPTAILLIIYAVCRGNRRKLPVLDMMSLQDL